MGNSDKQITNYNVQITNADLCFLNQTLTCYRIIFLPLYDKLNNMGCLVALFVFLWKAIKTVLKIAWKLLRILLFRWGLIFVAVYLLGALIFNSIYQIGLSPAGENQTWYFAGLLLAAICSAAFFVFRATRADGRRDKGKRR